VRAVRRVTGAGVLLMTDYNQALTVPEAMRRESALDDEGVYWIEEPMRADDYAGHPRIAQEVRTRIQLGYLHDMANSVAAAASDYVMPDAVKVGGVSGWLRAAALARAAGLSMSCHLFPEVSAHLLAAISTAHLVEFVGWANPVLQQPVLVKDGHVVAPDRPDIGIAWDEDAVARYIVP
jgi:mandelate racemase